MKSHTTILYPHFKNIKANKFKVPKNSSQNVVQWSTNTNLSVTELVDYFIKKGGKIDKFYLRDLHKTRRSLVHLKGWFSGKNLREAIEKALP